MINRFHRLNILVIYFLSLDCSIGSLVPEKRPECILSKVNNDRTKDKDTHERTITQAEM